MPTRQLAPDLDREMTPVSEYLDRHVELLRDAHRRRDRVAARLIRAAGSGETTEDEVLASELTLEQARVAIARDDGYPDWAVAQAHAEDLVDADFEAAGDAIQWGDLESLQALLDERPELVRAHQAARPQLRRARLSQHGPRRRPLGRK